VGNQSPKKQSVGVYFLQYGSAELTKNALLQTVFLAILPTGLYLSRNSNQIKFLIPCVHLNYYFSNLTLVNQYYNPFCVGLIFTNQPKHFFCRIKLSKLAKLFPYKTFSPQIYTKSSRG